MIRTGVIVALLAAFVGVANADEQLGAELYADSCARCHGDEADGLRGFDLDPTAFRARLEGLTRDMPDFTDYFDDDEIEAMYVYLQARAAAFAQESP